MKTTFIGGDSGKSQNVYLQGKLYFGELDPLAAFSLREKIIREYINKRKPIQMLNNAWVIRTQLSIERKNMKPN